MLFRKKIERNCAYCIYSTKMDDGNFLCAKKGIRPEDAKCHRFRYDPTKRIPAKAAPLDFSKYDADDFTL